MRKIVAIKSGVQSGSIFRDVREQKDLTTRDLQKLTGIKSNGFVSELERGKKRNVY